MVYYSCLAGFFSAMMYGFFQTLSETEPTQQGMMSLIKGNPGMGFRPQADHDSTLIQFSTQDVNTYADEVANLMKYLKENNYIDDKNVSIDPKIFDGTNKDCGIDSTNVNKSFGYADGQPCILLKMNKVFGWIPQMFDNDSLTTEHGEVAKKMLGDRLTGSDIGVSCEGENDAEQDSMGLVEFFPRNGFSGQYFPYLNAPDYRAPLVWAKFRNATRGTVLQIWCKAWAQNIYHHKNDKAGSVRFELLIDEKKN